MKGDRDGRKKEIKPMTRNPDYPSDIRSKHLPEDYDEMREWSRKIEAEYPFPGPCWNCGRDETLVILPDIGEVRCYCGCTVARKVDGKVVKVQDVWAE
jgi:hypothetical protein